MTRILIVDDEADIREILSFSLRAAHYEVVEAANVRKANALLFVGVHFDLVISDIGMEHPNAGIEFAEMRRVLQDNTPILLMSSTRPAEIDSLLVAGTIQGFFQKPLDYEKIVETTGQLLVPNQ